MEQDGAIEPTQAAPTSLPDHTGWPGPVRWTGMELLFVLFLAPLWASLAAGVLHAIGFYDWYYGPDLVALAASTSDVGATARRLAQARLVLWSSCLAFLPQLASVLGVLYLLSGTRPRDVGLTTRRLGLNLLAGFLTALTLTPAVYALNYLVAALHGERMQEHPFTQLGAAGISSSEWAFLGFAAIVVAPVGEELLFRGLLLPWCATRRWGGHLAMGAAFAVALASRFDLLLDTVKEGLLPFLRAALPVLCLLGLVPVYLLVYRRSRTSVGPALFATAVLFGWVHSRVWPSPIPLALLGLGLGYLAYRTRSLVGPILLHALFNGAAFVYLFVHVKYGGL